MYILCARIEMNSFSIKRKMDMRYSVISHSLSGHLPIVSEHQEEIYQDLSHISEKQR